MRSARLRYHPLSASEATTFHRLCVDAHIRRYLFDDKEVDLEWVRGAIAQSQALFARHEVGLWLVEREGEFIGFAGFHGFPQLSPEPQLIFALTQPHTGQGLASEVAQRLCQHADELGWERVVAAVDESNRASARVLAKCGFVARGRVPGPPSSGSGPIQLLAREQDPGLQWNPVSIEIARLYDGRPAGVDEKVELELQLCSEDVLIAVDAPFHDDPPPPSAPGSTPQLWNHEVVELMLLGEDERYLEVELGPHGHYLVLFLHHPRQLVHQGVTLDFSPRISGRRWTAEVRLPRLWLPPGCAALNAFAIHGSGPKRRYLAWQPAAGGRPDFHQLDLFADLPG